MTLADIVVVVNGECVVYASEVKRWRLSIVSIVCAALKNPAKVAVLAP
jgi:hypothetical protein